MKIVLIGAPASGKGTQSSMLKQSLGIPHISTGELFRYNIAQKTKIGLIAERVISAGKLVSDKIVNKMVKTRLKETDCKKGWMLDGYPRTIKQAKALNKTNPPDVVFFIDVSDAEAMERNNTRRTCKNCGKTFSTKSYENPNCDACDGQLVQRTDEKTDVFALRMQLFKTLNEPIVKYYREQGKLRTINGDMSMTEIYNEIMKILNSFKS